MHPWNQPILDSLKGRLDRLPHAILLHGPRGVGKLALAETMAQLFLCEHKDPKARPCGQCDGCRWYLAGNHPDFRRLEVVGTVCASGPEQKVRQPLRVPDGVIYRRDRCMEDGEK